MAIPVLGWIDVAGAALYFANERPEFTVWSALTSAVKQRAMNCAYNRIYYCGKWNIPASPSADLLVRLGKAQCEMAYYIAQHLPDEDRRKGLQIQGVAKAGIVEETYNPNWIDKIPIPLIVDALLKSIEAKISFGMVDIDRDEDKSVNEDATDL